MLQNVTNCNIMLQILQNVINYYKMFKKRYKIMKNEN